MIVEILPLVCGAVAVGDGMVRAVVIAGEAGEALAVVQPLGLGSQSATDVAHGAYVGTDAAHDAALAVDAKRLVGDEPTGEGTAEQP